MLITLYTYTLCYTIYYHTIYYIKYTHTLYTYCISSLVAPHCVKIATTEGIVAVGVRVEATVLLVLPVYVM